MSVNSIKNTLISIFVALISCVLVFSVGFINRDTSNPEKVYQIYLDGEKIGLIENKDELYDLINQEQIEIKNRYDVDKVYPPKGFNIMEHATFNENVTSVQEIYNMIKNEKEFTVKGYTITIRNDDEDFKPIYINVLDKEVFEMAINNIITTFVAEDKYKAYINGNQLEITDVGSVINYMGFEEEITIKESYISVADNIYTDDITLTKYLLFNEAEITKEYAVKAGDSIETIAFNNKLNVREFLIVNPNYRSAEALLAIGEKVNVTLINPVLTLVYDMEVVEDVRIPYEVETSFDYSKAASYKSTEQDGVDGITRITKQIRVVNGEENQGAIITNSTVIRAVQNEKIVRGRRAGNQGTYVDTGQSWAWPTNSPYVITSSYGYRWGGFHYGIDISGTGHGSPIYAALDGVVIAAGKGGILGANAGINVAIQHANGYYTSYGHLAKALVSVGQTVSRGQKIGTMGSTGYSTGTHLHFGVSSGVPYSTSYHWINPRSLYR